MCSLRVVVGLALPHEATIRLRSKAAELNSFFPRLSEPEWPATVLPIAHFDNVTAEGEQDIRAAMQDMDLGFEVTLFGLDIVPKAKKPREIITRVKIGKRPLQALHTAFMKHPRMAAMRHSRPFVPTISLGRFLDVANPRLDPGVVVALSFEPEIAAFRADSLIVLQHT